MFDLAYRRHLRITFPVVLVAVMLVPAALADGQAFYLVSDYDPRRDTAAPVSGAMERAAAENKRVILVLGGDWCGWCKVLEDDVDRSEKLIDVLEEHYLIAKVYCDSGSPGHPVQARANSPVRCFLRQRPRQGVPHLVILDSDGNRLLSRRMGGLVKKGRYSEKKLLRVLNRHK